MEENGANEVVKIYARGETIKAQGEPLSQMGVIRKGKAVVRNTDIAVYLEPGAVIGLMDMGESSYSMDYVALEDLEICMFDYKKPEDFRQFFVQDDCDSQLVLEGCMKAIGQLIHIFNMEKMFSDQICKYVKKQYEHYKELSRQMNCEPRACASLEQAKPAEYSMGQMEDLKQYYTELTQVDSEVRNAFFENGDVMVLRHLKELPQLARTLTEGCESLLKGVVSTLKLLCGDDNDNIFMIYGIFLQSNTLPKEIARDVLLSMKSAVDLQEKIEKMMTGKLHLKVNGQAQKYRRMFESVKENYRNNADGDGDGLSVQLEDINSLDNVSGMLDKLLDYSQLDETFTMEFREVLQEYCDMPDKTSTENDARALRKKITSLFYKLYKRVFFRTENENERGAIFDLFLNYGIVDETLFKPETLQNLINHRKDGKEYPIKVYTIREWLHEIYVGNKEPSRNEFDQDYKEYLRELTKSRVDITPAELEQLNSREEKVKFEIKNFLKLNNRLTSGHLLTFCPVLMEEDLGENYMNQIATEKKVNEAFNKILSVDFSVFYRDVLYDDPDNGINKLMIHQEVLPDVICMPNAGTMGRMWQEISGRKRASAGRFTLPVILKEDMLKVVVRMIGNFRWEICKRVQGNYWNDVSEPSLTSEFCDYIQFYKKNRDLSEKAKEKIAQSLVKCRNNYGEIFANDYIVWVISESAGNVRLDKVARSIMGRYCPFVKEIRAKLSDQPMFMDAIARYERERVKKSRELHNRRAAIRNCNGTETEEFLQEIEFCDL